jgi:hypothetical protein
MGTVTEKTGNNDWLAPQISFCEESRRLLEAFGEAVKELRLLHEEQFLAVVEGDTDSHRFDLLIHMAIERKHQAKYAYLAHTEAHGC